VFIDYFGDKRLIETADKVVSAFLLRDIQV